MGMKSAMGCSNLRLPALCALLLLAGSALVQATHYRAGTISYAKQDDGRITIFIEFGMR